MKRLLARLLRPIAHRFVAWWKWANEPPKSEMALLQQQLDTLNGELR